MALFYIYVKPMTEISRQIWNLWNTLHQQDLMEIDTDYGLKILYSGEPLYETIGRIVWNEKIWKLKISPRERLGKCYRFKQLSSSIK